MRLLHFTADDDNDPRDEKIKFGAFLLSGAPALMSREYSGNVLLFYLDHVCASVYMCVREIKLECYI